MAGRWGKGIHGRIRIFAILFALVSAISGCAEVQEGPRDEAVRVYDYKGSGDEVFVGTPTLSPTVVSAGDRLTRVLPFTVLAPQKETTFTVLEIVIMAGKGIVIELSRKDSEIPQGTHTSTVQFLIPKDLPRGGYDLITTIIANGIEKKAIGSFVV